MDQITKKPDFMDAMVKLLVSLQGSPKDSSPWGARGQQMLPEIMQQMQQKEAARRQAEAQAKMLQLQQKQGATGNVPVHDDGKIRPFDALRLGGVQ